MSIINSRKDYDALPEITQQQFKAGLAGTINTWAWQSGEWVLVQDDSAIKQYGFTLADFPDAPIPEQPASNPDRGAKDQRISEIKSELSRLDLESVRPIRAINAGTATEYDRNRLAELDAEAESLRQELAAL